MSIQPWDHNDLRDAAIAYATSGHRVFPTVPFGKMPLLPKPEKGDPELSPLADWQDREKGGFHAAVNEPGYVGALWAAVAKGANIGLGIPPGVVVLDLDDRGDDSAIELLTEQHGMLADLLASADTFRVRSPSGMHIYFKTTADLTTSHANGGVYSGVRAIVDIKVGGKTYVLLPPSQKSDGRRYAHLAGDLSQLAELPEEWVAALQDGAGRHSGRSAAPRAGARPRAQLKPSLHTSDGPQRLPAEPLPDGTARHPILFREACAMRERGYLEAEILPLMRALNRRLFTTPKDADLLQTMVADVCGRYAVGDIEPPASSTETADFTSTELYRELSRMFGERESLDYLLDAVCAPRATAPRRVLCVRGDVDSAAGLFDALERGFGAAAVGHLPYAALIPGAAAHQTHRLLFQSGRAAAGTVRGWTPRP